MEDAGFVKRDVKDVDDICTTLFESYLRNSRTAEKVEERGMWEQKATSLLPWQLSPRLLQQPYSRAERRSR